MSANQSSLRTSLPSTHAAASDINAHQTPPKHPQKKKNPKPTPTPKPGSDPRHVAIALHHAHRIQAQKDTEALILDRILELATFPPSTADPTAPSLEDARAFKTALLPFQPADYDNLILERNIEGLCGYGLCPREHRTEGDGSGQAGGSFRITYGAKGSGPRGQGRAMNIVPREKMEMWCSNECAERAMYIRVQLGEEPVWERRGDNARTAELVLLEEGRSKGKARSTATSDSATVGQVTGQLENLHMQAGPESSDVADQIQDLSIRDDTRSQELALERGDSSSSAFQHGGRVDVDIKEKENTGHAQAVPPQLRPEDAQGGSIEGYVPKPKE